MPRALKSPLCPPLHFSSCPYFVCVVFFGVLDNLWKSYFFLMKCRVGCRGSNGENIDYCLFLFLLLIFYFSLSFFFRLTHLNVHHRTHMAAVIHQIEQITTTLTTITIPPPAAAVQRTIIQRLLLVQQPRNQKPPRRRRKRIQMSHQSE